MPIHIYHCECGIDFEALVMTVAQLADVDCPRCHSKKIDWVPATFGFNFKSNPLGSYRGPASNPYENLTLQHVRDEQGKPVTVNSLAELRKAEKEHGFVHAQSNAANDIPVEPPQHEKWAGDIRHDYEWKWTPPEQRNDMTGVSAGATTKDQLLIGV